MTKAIEKTAKLSSGPSVPAGPKKGDLKTRKMAAGEFKAKCLAVMDEVQKKRETVVITKRGKPVAKLVPVEDTETDSIFGFLKGKGRVVGDVVSPIFSSEEWGDLA